MSDKKKSVTIPLETYQELLDDQNFLDALRAAGVDNWDGYDYAREEFNEVSETEAIAEASKYFHQPDCE